MAMLQKIFSSKKPSSNFFRDGRKAESTQKTVSPKLDKNKIRLVIYAESDRGRTPFFDSDAIKKTEDIEKTQNIRKSNQKTVRSKIQGENAGSETKPSPRYHFSRLGNDVKVLEEMMFGTVQLAFKGSTLKVHVLRSPNKLMLTKVFFPEKPREDTVTCDSGSESMTFTNSNAEMSSGEFSFPMRKSKAKDRSIPVDVPSKELLSDCSTDDDSSFASFTSSGSLRVSFPSPSNNSLSSFNSLHKRWMRAQTTSLDGNHRKTYDPVSSIEGTGKRIRRHKLAVGILFGSGDEDEEESYKLFRSFLFSHFALIEGHLEKLCRVIEKAYFNNKTALPVTIEALDQFRNLVYDLYMAPRLPEPVWLTMMSSTTYRSKLCEKFMKEFNYLVANYDNKNYNFFVSTLLSAVLTQHLAWVATVSPAEGTPTKTYLEKHTAKWIDTLAKTHPYNPLWAQLGDLYGAIGHPLKISRTVVVGKKTDLVKRFLYILSYFVRCSDMQEYSCCQNLSQLITNSSHSEESLSPTGSEKTIFDGISPAEPCPSPSPSVKQFRYGSSNSGVAIDHGLAEGAALKVNYNRESKAGAGRVSGSTQLDYLSKDKDSAVLLESGFETALSSSNSKNALSSSNSKKALSSSNSKHAESTATHELSLCFDDPLTPSSDLIHLESNPCHTCADLQKLGTGLCAAHSISFNGYPLNNSLEQGFEESRDLGSIPFSVSGDNSYSNVHTSMNDCREAFSDLHIYPSLISACSLSPKNICESPPVEKVQLVNKAFVSDQKDGISPGNSLGELDRSHSLSDGKIKSRLTQQLAASGTSGSEMTNSKKSEIRKSFLSEASSSMFDEYYESGIEVKTIDAVQDSEKPSLPSQVNLAASNNVKENMETEGKRSYSRQSSNQDAKFTSGKPGSLQRSISEISRRRHLSSTSSIDYDAFDPMSQCKEIKLPNLLWDHTNWNIRSFDRNFGRSLLASYTDHYMSDFVLHGTSEKKFKNRLLHDLQMAVQHSILDEPIDEAVCVIADTDNWTVEVASSKVMGISPSGSTPWMPSKLVADLIESVVEISKFKMGSEFCLMAIEDRLQEIYFKSIILSEYLNGGRPLNQQELASTLSFDRSDMPLLLAVAGTHTSSLGLGL